MPLQLFKQEGALKAHLLDAAIQALYALSCAIVVLFNVVDAPAQVNAFAVVGGLDGRWQIFLREGSRCYKAVSHLKAHTAQARRAGLMIEPTLLRHVCWR